MKLETALYQLKRSPLTFLRRNILSAASSPTSGVMNYYFCRENKINNDVNEFFRFNNTLITMNLARTGPDGKVYTVKSVHHLAVISNTAVLDIENINPYILDHTGPDIMITTLLSACIIAIQKVGNRLVVAHLQPGGQRPTSVVFRGIILREGRFSGFHDNEGHVQQVIGKGLEYTTYCNVIGIRTGGVWHLYGQIMNMPWGPVTDVVEFV